MYASFLLALSVIKLFYFVIKSIKTDLTLMNLIIQIESYEKIILLLIFTPLAFTVMLVFLVDETIIIYMVMERSYQMKEECIASPYH
jgi:hypothetical protein